MQPRDFEEEVSRSAERLNRKKRRIEALDRLRSAGNTPHSSPRSPLVLVQDTQPRSPVRHSLHEHFLAVRNEFVFIKRM